MKRELQLMYLSWDSIYDIPFSETFSGADQFEERYAEGCVKV